MRIAYVCADPGVPVFGCKGCSIHVQSILREMVASGFQVSLFARRLGGEIPDELRSVDVQKLSTVKGTDTAEREQRLVASNRELRLMLEQEGPFDLVYERYSLWSCAAMQFAEDGGTPSVLEINAPLVREQATHRELMDRQLANDLSMKAFNSAQVRLAVSQGVAAQVREDHPLSVQQRIDVIPNGVSREQFAATRRNVSRRQDSDNHEPFVVGFVGTIRPWHGLATLGEAFSRFHERLPASELLIVGDGAARAELESNLTATALLATTITGPVRHVDVAEWMGRMDAAVAPYVPTEQFYFSPLKVMEYFAAGLPVVCSTVSDFDGLVSSENAVPFTGGDARALANVLFDLSGDAVRRKKLSQAAVATISDQLTWSGVWQRVLALCGLQTAAMARSAG